MRSTESSLNNLYKFILNFCLWAFFSSRICEINPNDLSNAQPELTRFLDSWKNQKEGGSVYQVLLQGEGDAGGSRHYLITDNELQVSQSGEWSQPGVADRGGGAGSESWREAGVLVDWLQQPVNLATS